MQNEQNKVLTTVCVCSHVSFSCQASIQAK